MVTALTEGGFEYALIGGVAVILSGYDRSTQDVDAVVWDLDRRLDQLIEALEKHGFALRVPDGRADARRIRVLRLVGGNGVNADISMALLPFEREVISRARLADLGENISARIATPEDLIIMKLIASRDRDLDDVTRLLEIYPDLNRSRIRATVKEYAEVLDNPEILENLRERLKHGPTR